MPEMVEEKIIEAVKLLSDASQNRLIKYIGKLHAIEKLDAKANGEMLSMKKPVPEKVFEDGKQLAEAFKKIVEEFTAMKAREKAREEARASSEPKCSFCDKAQKQARKMVAGHDVYICDECIELCCEIIDDELSEDLEAVEAPIVTGSSIAKHICLTRHPVAVLWAEAMPPNAIHFKEGKWGCVVALIKAASRGKVAAATLATTVCQGGKAGLGFQGYEHGWIEYFLSTGNENIAHSERYKKTPELARQFVDTIPRISPGHCIVFKPLGMVSKDERPECVIFLVNADQLSGLVTLANYDQASQGDVQVRFASGCAQAVLYPLAAEQGGEKTCYIGMTDPSARKVIGKEQLSFSIPYSRFLEMEQEADASFLTADTWEIIKRRLEK